MKPKLKTFLTVVGVFVLFLAMLFGFALNIKGLTAWGYAQKYQKTGYSNPDVVLMGSSTIQNWKTSVSDLGPLKTVNVGIGGTVVRDWFSYLDTLVTPFAPKAVLVYVAANDLHNDHRDPGDVAADLTRLLDDLHAALPEAKLYYVSVYATGAQPESRADEKTLNDAMAALCEGSAHLRYIDCAAALIGADGDIREELFRGDLVHLNDAGYEIWTETIKRALDADLS
ncbi:MAG TPA: GDSL-type esterase/lipase family protein [Clostridia bacterium]|nr:GDSL-type esterase/lipase family protein [Clostridia bacterium]